jgi:hypothetical protein
MTIFPTIDDFYKEHPHILETLQRMRPEGEGPEYDEQRRAFAAFMHNVSCLYALWSVTQPMTVLRDRLHHDE